VIEFKTNSGYFEKYIEKKYGNKQKIVDVSSALPILDENSKNLEFYEKNLCVFGEYAHNVGWSSIYLGQLKPEESPNPHEFGSEVLRLFFNFDLLFSNK